MEIVAVDLFCGVGGLTHGLIKAGIKVRAGIDIDPICKYPYEFNNKAKFIQKDVAKVSGEELESLLGTGDIRVVAGCAPCQPFSSYTQWKEQKYHKDWGLLYSFAELVKHVQPEIVTMENVPQLVQHRVFDDFVDTMIKYDYFVSFSFTEGPLYGVPQTRRRLVLFASRLGPIRIVPPTHTQKTCPTVRKKIGRLEPIAAGEISVKDPLHRASKLSELNMRRIQASKPGGTWRDWPSELIAQCHKLETGSTYPAVYGRMEWSKPAPTITTQAYGFGNGRFGHPDQNRALSLREMALLQTFPKKYKFFKTGDSISMKQFGRIIGNAVPVRLGQIVGESIFRHVKEYDNNVVRSRFQDDPEP